MLMILAMGLYAFSMSITPGPVNLIIFSGGMNRGIQATLPFILGATIGFSLLLLATGLGLGWVVQQHKWLVYSSTVIGCGFMMYLSLQLFKSEPRVGQTTAMRSGWWAGFMLMWLNPKAWLAAIAGNSLFIEPSQTSKLFVFVLIYSLVCFVSLLLWAVFGKQVSHYILNDKYVRWLNKAAALVIAGMCVMVLYELGGRNL
ncbi:LysE family translocator [Pseudoalteromonas luteoviolacea]|uniref:LysE family translocator n=1 Tax=Pseudoalteromonas luteoviolacea TaxID=43657 RepID=UPI001F20E69B|nr:LysE family translocator [Pseudoalteromonas luteoviolacea]MCF6440541.1 LysE family translocator [Pseudoalteromonas luteoviolacea]